MRRERGIIICNYLFPKPGYVSRPQPEDNANAFNEKENSGNNVDSRRAADERGKEYIFRCFKLLTPIHHTNEINKNETAGKNVDCRRSADDEKHIGAQLLNLDMTSLLSRDLYNHPYNHRRSNQYRQTVYIEYNLDTCVQCTPTVHLRLDYQSKGRLQKATMNFV